MFRFFTPVLLLQAFCIYHIYSNKTDHKWYILIIFLPLLGSFIYLFHHFYSRQNIDTVTEGVKHVFNSNYKIEQLEKQLKFSDTVANKILLADEYTLAGNNKEAEELYKSCLVGVYKDDPDLIRKLMRISYKSKAYDTVIDYGRSIETDVLFKKSEERIAYAWAYFYKNDYAEAERNFEALDDRFTQYKHRLEYATFLFEIQKKQEGLQKLEQLLEEIDSMDRQEKHYKKAIYNEILNCYRAHSKE